jgi:hypothetical protein
MNTLPLQFLSRVPLCLLASLCLHVPAAEPGPWQNKQTFSTDSKDSELCQKQMTRIYAVIQDYYKELGEFPDKLSDLIPEFLHDPEELVCPYVRNTGDLTGWRQHVDHVVFDDPRSSYTYEFSSKPTRWGPEWTAGQLKRSHMKLFGLHVPVVRCFAHRPRLNLAYDGTVYQSNFEWEDALLICNQQRALFHEALADPDLITPKLLAALRPARAYMDLSDRQLDLASSYNAPLAHLGRMDLRGQLLSTHPMSAECINGVLFDVRGLIHLGGQKFPISFPLEVDGIRVETKSERMHFLHGTVQSPHVSSASLPAGVTNAVYTIHFADGKKENFPIVYGRDVKALRFNRNELPEPSEAKPAWICAVLGTQGAHRLYLATWQNPFPDRLIKSVSIRSLATNSAPFLVAITLESPSSANRR